MTFEFERQHRLPDSEFTTDLEYQKTMDSAWHGWLQPKYAEQFKVWESKFLPIQEIGIRLNSKPQTPESP